MKIWDWVKIFGKREIEKADDMTYTVLLNDIQLEKVKAYSAKSHHHIYKQLRAFKAPRYDKFYVFRGKAGFNTIGFTIKYDVVVTDRNGKIIDLKKEVEVGEISNHYKEGYFIFFTTVGTINYYNLKNNDLLKLRRVWI